MDEELLLQGLNGVGVGDEHLCLALVLNPAVSAPIQAVWKVKGKLVAKAEGKKSCEIYLIFQIKIKFYLITLSYH